MTNTCACGVKVLYVYLDKVRCLMLCVCILTAVMAALLCESVNDYMGVK